MLKFHDGSYSVLNSFLEKAGEQLWTECRQDRSLQQESLRSRFLLQYRYDCVPTLTGIIYKWTVLYGCNEAFADFYAVQLTETAKSLMFKSYPAPVQKILSEKPRAQNIFFYDSDEWEKLKR